MLPEDGAALARVNLGTKYSGKSQHFPAEAVQNQVKISVLIIASINLLIIVCLNVIYQFILRLCFPKFYFLFLSAIFLTSRAINI